MSERVITDPSQHGWVLENGKWVWDASGSGGGAGAGMVISDTEPTDKTEGMQWLNPTTGLVLFWDDEKWLQMPTTGAAGKDGVDGADGADGADGIDGSLYDDSWIQPALDNKLDASKIVICTQAEYDGLSPSADTVYFIT